MLTLTRKVGEAIRIGDDIAIVVKEIRKNQVRISIVAPREVKIYREEVYDKSTPRAGIADITIAKQRNGPTGEFPLTFLGKYTRFENYAPESSAFE